jgi:histone deacetylase 1/2
MTNNPLVGNCPLEIRLRRISHQLPFSLSTRVTTSPLEIIYSDVWGPGPISTSGHEYYVSFVDAYSRFT